MRSENYMKLLKKLQLLVWLAGAAAAVLMLTGAAGSTVSVRAAGRTVTIQSCLINGSNVTVQMSASSVPSSDDGKIYIVADEVYQDGTAGEVVGSCAAGSSASVSFPLNFNSASSNLDRKFIAAVKQGGTLVQVSDEHYITNPEAIATHTSARMPRGIKGILPDPTRVNTGELQDLGIQQVVYNMYVDDICSAASVPGAIPYTYNGTTYYFDPTMVGSYDSLITIFNNMGIEVTMVLLNKGTGTYSQDLIHPLARGGFSSPGYALNVAEAGGVQHLKAVAAFIGERYSGRIGCGQVDNWIIGNEVNARTEWWYTSSSNLDVNVGAYVKAFRIIYNELKAKNANVQVYNSIDQEWNRKSNSGSFLAKEYLDRFNYYIVREGNIDWGLSYHPYNSPLYDPYAWNGPAVWVQQSITTPYITMQNIDILINYMHQASFLNPAGQVRSISLAEIGYTSSFGNDAQEASIAYGYLKASTLPDVDAFMLFRQTDSSSEMTSHLALGLIDVNGNHKPAYEIYKKLGTAAQGEAAARASQIIGTDIINMITQGVVWTRGGDGVVQ